MCEGRCYGRRCGCAELISVARNTLLGCDRTLPTLAPPLVFEPWGTTVEVDEPGHLELRGPVTALTTWSYRGRCRNISRPGCCAAPVLSETHRLGIRLRSQLMVQRGSTGAERDEKRFSRSKERR